MKKYVARIILIILTGSLLFPAIAVPTKSSVETSAEITVETVEIITFPEFQYVEQNTSNNCLIEIEQCNSYIKFLLNQNATETADEILRVEAILNQHNKRYEELLKLEQEELLWGEKLREYPEATKIWRIMKEEFDWSDTVCAGIMGNMMAEVAGGTLHALNKWDTDKSSGYGLIQWIGGRKKDIKAKYGNQPSIEEQLYFMRDEMFGTNSVRKQITDTQLNAIMNASTPEKVAYNFARYFERCAGFSYNNRKNYARIAYNYFVD